MIKSLVRKILFLLTCPPPVCFSLIYKVHDYVVNGAPLNVTFE